MEGVQKALGEDAKEVLGDVKNFSNADPILLVGEVTVRYEFLEFATPLTAFQCTWRRQRRIQLNYQSVL